MSTQNIILCTCIVLCATPIFAQNDSVKTHLSVNIDTKVFISLQKQYSYIKFKLDKQSIRLLTTLQHKEDEFQKQLNLTDSAKAQELFTDDIKQRYTDLKSDFSKATDRFKRFPLQEYIPSIDSVQTCLSFLIDNSNLPKDNLQQLQALFTKLKDLQSELQKANNVSAFISERETFLKQQLMNSGLTRRLTGINKKVFYYHKQLSEYKALLNDKEKFKETLLQTIKTLPAFQKFWEKNSYLAALFPMPSNYSTPQSLAGLQTRVNVQNIIVQRISTSAGIGSNAQQYFEGQINAAQAQLNQLKEKLNKFSNAENSSYVVIPDFKPSTQKSKTFLQRLEYGFNIQNEPSRYTLPATSDLALTVGYKLSDKKRIGIGTSYKLGWGNGFNNIHITNEGLGLRSYLDIKAKGSIWLSGGFEYNYLSSFRSLQELHDNIDVWQSSALIGLSKKYKVGKKEGNIQLLYDLLHNQQKPPSTALKFRIGYMF